MNYYWEGVKLQGLRVFIYLVQKISGLTIQGNVPESGPNPNS
jgi:hypothetical protein